MKINRTVFVLVVLPFAMACTTNADDISIRSTVSDRPEGKTDVISLQEEPKSKDSVEDDLSLALGTHAPFEGMTDVYRVPFEDFCVDLGNPSGGKFCVSIKPNGRYCEPWPEDDGEEKKLYKHEPGYGPWSPVDANNRFVFFEDSIPGGPFKIGACERSTLQEYTIVESADASLYYSVDREHLIVNVCPVEYNDYSVLYYINLDTGLATAISDAETCSIDVTISYPVAVVPDNPSQLYRIYDIEKTTLITVEGLQGFLGDVGKGILIVDAAIGYGEESTSLLDGPLDGPNIFGIDPATGDFKPIIVTAGLYNGYSHIDAGRWVLFTSYRAAQYVSTFDQAGAGVYLFDMKTKREMPISVPKYGNSFATVLEYPYVGWAYGGDPAVLGGVHFIKNIETGEVWKFIGQDRDTDATLHHRIFYYTADNSAVYAAKLPALPLYPDDDSFCDDGNPCTDDRYFVTGRRCLNEPNRDQCDDGDMGTLFSNCIDGECRGLAIIADPVEEVHCGTLDTKEIYLDKYEVTQKRYRECVDEGICNSPTQSSSATRDHYWDDPAYDNYPVIYVTYYDAAKYCAWRGKQLPTSGRVRTTCHGNDKVTDDSRNDTAEAGSYAADETNGIYDLGGNVGEWVMLNWTWKDSPHPEIDFGDDLKWVDNSSWHNRWIGPTTPWSTNFDIGFRCTREE